MAERKRKREGMARIHSKEGGGAACGLNVLGIEYK